MWIPTAKTAKLALPKWLQACQVNQANRLVMASCLGRMCTDATDGTLTTNNSACLDCIVGLGVGICPIDRQSKCSCPAHLLQHNWLANPVWNLCLHPCFSLYLCFWAVSETAIGQAWACLLASADGSEVTATDDTKLPLTQTALRWPHRWAWESMSRSCPWLSAIPESRVHGQHE